MSQQEVTFHMTTDAIKECSRISERLRHATTAQEVHDIADEERETVQRLAADERNKPLARNIANLKAYILQVELPAMKKRRNS